MSLKIEDLMINDLVLHNSRPEKVNKDILRELIPDTSPYFKIKDYEPIFLTKEILEKNGFVSKRKYGLHFYLPHKGFEIFECFDGGGIDVVGYGLTINKKTVGIYYVHQLQHALRLVGLNELADNFKV